MIISKLANYIIKGTFILSALYYAEVKLISKLYQKKVSVAYRKVKKKDKGIGTMLLYTHDSKRYRKDRDRLINSYIQSLDKQKQKVSKMIFDYKKIKKKKSR